MSLMFQEEITLPNWKRQKRNGDENKSCNEENMNILLHEKEFSDDVNDINSNLIICQVWLLDPPVHYYLS